MKKAAGLLGVVLALGVGYYIFKAPMTQGPPGGAPSLSTLSPKKTHYPT